MKSQNGPEEHLSFQIKALRKAKKLGYKHPLDTQVGSVKLDVLSIMDGNEVINSELFNKLEADGTQRHVAMMFFEDCKNKGMTVEEMKQASEKFFKEYWENDGLEIIPKIKNAVNYEVFPQQ